MKNERTERAETGNLPPERVGKEALLLNALQQQREQSWAVKEDLARREPNSESAQAAEIMARVADKKIELFARERDFTGSWKHDRLGRNLVRDMRDQDWESDESGHFKITDEDQRNHLLLINLGELDRLNQAGGHALGDAGLKLAVEQAEQTVREILSALPEYKDERRLAEAYDFYRYSGNDFVLNLRRVDVEIAEEIRKRLSYDVSRGSVDLSSVKAGVEAAPLSVSRVSRADGLALLNQLEFASGQAGLNNQKILLEAMFEKLQTLNDLAKNESRLMRMSEKMRAAVLYPEAEAEAKQFFEQFMRKALSSMLREGGGAVLDYEKLKQVMLDKRAFDIPASTEWTHFVSEQSLRQALENLKERRAVGRQIELNLARVVARDTLRRVENFGLEAEFSAVPLSAGSFTAPLQTNGQEALARLAAAAQEARASGELGAAQAKLARVEYQIEAAKRDNKTGLYGRQVYFETLEDAWENKKSAATIVVDMAFLKYFDKEGGTQAGDMSIQKVAEILDTLANQFTERYEAEGVKVEVYRLGGDEFAINVIGGDSEIVKQILDLMRQAESGAGRVPAGPGARAAYQPEALRFNYGVREARDAESFKQELEQAGIPLKHRGTELEKNELTEYLWKLADTELEIQKSCHRLMMLVERALQVKETGETGNFEILLAYSQKAIFGEAGSKKIQELVKALADSREYGVTLGEVRGEIIKFVIDQMDQRNLKAEQFRTALDHHIEEAVRRRFFENRIYELEEQIGALQEHLKREISQREDVTRELRAAQAEMRAVRELRERIARPGAPSVAPPSLRAA